jgi:hypothetical protein
MLTPDQRAAVHALRPIQLPRGWASPPGCTCGGVEIHVTTCPFLDQSPEEVLAAIDASRAKLSALSDELTTEARAFWQRWESP